MQLHNTQQEWEKYCERELAIITPLLKKLGFELEDDQPHLGGERYLMQAVTTASGKKLILLGRRKINGQRVVIKATDDPAGMNELKHERECRQILARINFAYQTFHSPEELFFGRRNGHMFSIQRFIDQEIPFLSRPLAEQFALALESFKAQESAHATTYGHEKLVRNAFGTMSASDYLAAFAKFKEDILRKLPTKTATHELLDETSKQLEIDRETIEQYCGFLTHTDFVPHNIRINNGNIYLLDHSSLRFGNKYEGWARFVNFMTLHNPPLADAMSEYIRLNRTPEESLSLKLMRIYRLGEIIWYYANTIQRSSGNLRILNEERVHFWTQVLEAVLRDEKIPTEIVDNYRIRRDSLRSEDEKLRQKDLH
ncbi:MAG: hypothetical protein WCW36_01935 [Candidatus Paceibacterota bacterium]|jgi:hypothetical protein